MAHSFSRMQYCTFAQSAHCFMYHQRRDHDENEDSDDDEPVKTGSNIIHSDGKWCSFCFTNFDNLHEVSLVLSDRQR